MISILVLRGERLPTDRKLAYPAGTKDPHVAMTVNKPICRRYVLFPDMLFDNQMLMLLNESRINKLWALDDLERRRIITINVIRDKGPCSLYSLQYRMSP
jgi:hypothetical protein